MGCQTSKVTAEMVSKVGDEELSPAEVENLDSELNPASGRGKNREEKISSDVKRLESFQKNLQVYQAQHGEEALQEKYGVKMGLGEQAPNAKALSAKGRKRGSVLYDESAEYREMLTLLEDPGAQKFLGQFVIRSQMKETMFCWVDCNDFLEIPTTDYRRCKALAIINKYVKTGAKEEIGCLGEQDREYYCSIADAITAHTCTPEDLTIHFFDRLSNSCFREMVKNTLIPFKDSDEYAAYVDIHQDSSSMKVLVSDFDYMAILGQGGFGRVVHARKKSTGKHFAMKIQPKASLIEEHGGNLANLHTEKTVFANCNHPFVVDMCYAVQTPSHAILVLSLVDGGDLNDLLWRAPGGKLTEYHGRIYAAQIGSALAHLHEVGVLFRDLKPENVLICGMTGNCKLTDMGLAAPIVVTEEKDGPEKLAAPATIDEKWKGPELLKSKPRRASNVGGVPNLRLLSKRMSIGEDVEVVDAAAQATAFAAADASGGSETYDTNAGETGETASTELDAKTVHADESEIHEIAESALLEDVVAKEIRRGSMMVQHAALDEDSTVKILMELEKLRLNSPRGEKDVVKMTEAEVSRKRIKRMSVVGTRGYMAPEIVEGKVLRRKERRGYNETVDWFALGVTVFVMLTGYQPFNDDDKGHVDPKVLAENFPRDSKGILRRPSGFATLLQVVKFPAKMSVASCAFCRELLHIQPAQRLGANGYDEIKHHEWFVEPQKAMPADMRAFGNDDVHPLSELEPMHEDALLQDEYKVPEWVYKTARSKALQRVYEPGAQPKYNHFEHIMATFDIRDQRRYVEWYSPPEAKEQEIFDSWDFMSYGALKDELNAQIDPKLLKKRVPRESRGTAKFRTNKALAQGHQQF